MVIGIGIGIGISLNQARLYQFKSTDGDGLVCKLHSRCVNGGQVETGGRYNTAQVTTVQGMLPCGEWQVASGRWQAGWQVCGGIDASRDGMWGKVMFVGMLWGRLLLRSMWGGCSLHLQLCNQNTCMYLVCKIHSCYTKTIVAQRPPKVITPLADLSELCSAILTLIHT